MIAVDTNVLIRFFIRDDEGQYILAESLLQKTEDSGRKVFISNIVLVELIWVLIGGYKVTKTDLIRTISFLLSNDLFQFSNRSVIRKALDKYRSGKADFADYMIGCEGLQQKAITTYTFDKCSGQDEAFTVLSKAA